MGVFRAQVFGRLAVASALAFAGGPMARGQESSPYEVRPSDVLEVIVVGQASLSGDYTVAPDETIAFPLLGKVVVRGLTAPAVQAKLQKELIARDYFKRPEVSVRVKEFRSHPVMVLGEVPKPGLHPLKGDRSLLSLLADVGGLTPGAGHEIVIARPPEGLAAVAVQRFAMTPVIPGLSEAAGNKGDGDLPPGALEGSDVFRASVKGLQRGNEALNVILEGGDLVYVPRAAQVTVDGEVVNKGSYRFEEDMTVLDLLTAAGGVSERGSQRRLEIERVEDGKIRRVKAKLEDPLRPGDRLKVGARIF